MDGEDFSGRLMHQGNNKEFKVSNILLVFHKFLL